MEKITLEYLESHFDEVLGQAEGGKSFLILTPDGKDIALVPDKDKIESSLDVKMATSIENDEWLESMNQYDL